MVVPFGPASHADWLRADGSAAAGHPLWDGRRRLRAVRRAVEGAGASDRRVARPRRSPNVRLVRRSWCFRLPGAESVESFQRPVHAFDPDIAVVRPPRARLLRPSGQQRIPGSMAARCPRETAPDDTEASDLRRVSSGAVYLGFAGSPESGGPAWRRDSLPAVSPRADRWAVASEDLGFVRVPRRGGPVGVQDQGPSPAMDHNLMVEPTE